jgi:hypothetical protein
MHNNTLKKEVNMIFKRQGWKGNRYNTKGFTREANKIFNVKMEKTYLNPEYEVELFSESEIDEQGLLTICKLKTKRVGFPEFFVRWDEKGDHINIDMFPNNTCRKNWEKERRGYKGHKPRKVGEKTYMLLVSTPTIKVVEGTISFSLRRNVGLSSTLNMSGDLNKTKSD